MTLDFYDIEPIKTIHHFIIIRKDNNHKFKLKIIENPKDVWEEPKIIIIDAETNEEVDNQLWEEMNEELESKGIVY